MKEGKSQKNFKNQHTCKNFDRNDSMCFDCDESDRLVFYRTGERYIVRTV